MPRRSVPSVHVAHSTPGRVRLRVPSLRDDPARAEPVADAIAALDGVEDVQVRPRTGSVLCRYDPLRVAEARIAAAARAATNGRGPDGAASRRRLRQAVRRGTRITRAAAVLFKGVDADLMRGTEGRLDLADGAALGMLAAALAKLATAKELRLPSFFDLVWWAYTVFTRQERRAIERTPHPLHERPG